MRIILGEDTVLTALLLLLSIDTVTSLACLRGVDAYFQWTRFHRNKRTTTTVTSFLVRDLENMSAGKATGHFITDQWEIPVNGLDLASISEKKGVLDRSMKTPLTPTNLTLPIALMILDPSEYPTVSRARKALRKGAILVYRKNTKSAVADEKCPSNHHHHANLIGSNEDDSDNGDDEASGDHNLDFDAKNAITGRVGDRVYPFDIIARQIRMSQCFYPKNKDPPFEMPVIYEDDHIAIVNKPAGVPVFSHRKGGHGMMTVRSALPYILTAPKMGTEHALRRAQPVHRIDLATSGLLICAKTKPALTGLGDQFADRTIKKTYTAVLNGMPTICKDNPSDREWHTIDSELDSKSAVTLWRPIRFARSQNAKDETVTLVEVKPQTGRHHQIRCHMAWELNCPLIGDHRYDGGSEKAKTFRELGLFLCANRVSFMHPCFNSAVEACIELPEKYEAILTEDDSRGEGA